MYKRTIIRDLHQLERLIEETETYKGLIAFDTETTGLHLLADRPFLLTLTNETGSVALDLDKFAPADIQRLFDAMEDCAYVIGHNVKFDLHMLLNYGVIYEGTNLTDTMILARLSLDTDATRTLRLKTLAKMFLGEDSADDEKLVKSAMTSLKKDRNKIWKETLKVLGWTLTKWSEVSKDILFDPHKMGTIGVAWLEFLEQYPEPNYLDVYNEDGMQEIMLDYAMNDTEITLDLFKKFYPVMEVRMQTKIFQRENSLILPLLRMERVGINVDKKYIVDSARETAKYIDIQRTKLEFYFGSPIGVGQHKTIKQWFEARGHTMHSSDDRAMQHIINTCENFDTDAVEVAKLISELRTLEKWYSTYILRMLDKIKYDGRAYTQINQASAVTGRVSSDFQQFPKGALKKITGEELFNPRRAFIVTGGKFNKIYYLDYSQIELRVQANYTYLISGGDLNMCRAYMPFQCYAVGQFPNGDYKHVYVPETDAPQINNYVWRTVESNEIWTPVDLHSATTKQAFPDVPEGSPEFKKLRGLGKSTNFAKNYGATVNALVNQFGFEEDIANALDRGYYDAFPKILDYQNLVRQRHALMGWVKNMYGRRYYLSDRRWVYKLYNYLVQGTCADMLKEKIIEVDAYLKQHKSRFQMNIHDEMSFEIYDGEEHIIPYLVEIMEDVPWVNVPIIADVEVTYTNWADKEEVVF